MSVDGAHKMKKLLNEWKEFASKEKIQELPGGVSTFDRSRIEGFAKKYPDAVAFMHAHEDDLLRKWLMVIKHQTTPDEARAYGEVTIGFQEAPKLDAVQEMGFKE